jgi:hypothetical protein
VNTTVTYLVLILVAHWVGDYVLQTNAMAKRKSSSLKWLLIHVMVYLVPVAATALYLFSVESAVDFILLNGLLHLVTDLLTSRLALRFESKQRMYFTIVGFDQLVHSVTLVVTTIYFR